MLTLKKFNKNQKIAFYLIIAYALISPIFDLVIFKIIASLFSNDDMVGDDIVLILLPIGFLFAINAVVKYFSKIKKITYINSSVAISHDLAGDVLKSNINWLRMCYLESVNVFTSVGHVVMISMLSILLNFNLGVTLSAFSILIFFYFHFSLKKEIYNQKKIKYNSKLVAYQKGEQNVMSRIVASELISLVVNFLVFLFFSFLIFMYFIGEIDAHDGLIFLFITRFVSSNLSNMGASMMRLSRAWVNIFDKKDILLHKLSCNE